MGAEAAAAGAGVGGGEAAATAASAAGAGAGAKTVPWAGDVTKPGKLPDEISAENPLRVVIAGGGVGGLLAAKYMKMQGYDVRPI